MYVSKIPNLIFTIFHKTFSQKSKRDRLGMNMVEGAADNSNVAELHENRR